MWLQDKPSLVGFAKRVAGFKVSRAGGEVGIVHAGGEFLRPGQNPDVGFRNRIVRQSLEGEDVIVAENCRKRTSSLRKAARPCRLEA